MHSHMYTHIHTFALIHRQVRKVENYFLHPFKTVLFGEPLLVYLNPAHCTQADIYRRIWDKV